MGPARDDPLARQRFLGIMRGEAERMNRLAPSCCRSLRIEMNEHAAFDALISAIS